MIALAAKDRAVHQSDIDRAARAVGADVPALDRWLVSILEAWSRALGPEEVEPWDYTYRTSAGEREIAGRIPPGAMAGLNARFYQDLGVDLAGLGVMFDLAPRADKSSVAYTDFVLRGREVDGRWHRPVPRVVATLQRGGLGELNEFVHETGHAVHVSAIHTRPAYMDWPDSLFCEAFADVSSWSVYQPEWQRRYLGRAIPESASLRALYGNVMLDVAWSLFEVRMLQAPSSDPNVVWTDITQRYLHVKPHPELAWWALRVQMVQWPGYMVNYGLGAVLTAEMRRRTADAIGPFDAGNPRWYAWLSDQLLRFGSERDNLQLMNGLLGRPVSPDALLAELRRIGTPPR
jgi:oligoendopeptidase F